MEGWKSFRVPEYRGRLRQRLGLVEPQPVPGCLWIHAVSVGEVQAAVGLIQSLRREFPEVPVVVSTVTPTGAQRVRSFLRRVGAALLPAVRPAGFGAPVPRPAAAAGGDHPRDGDLADAVPRARPTAHPARAGERARLDPLGGSLSTDGVAVQGDAVARHPDRRADRRGRRALQAIGAAPERVRVTGNVKFDMEIPAASIAAGRAFREQCGRRAAGVDRGQHARGRGGGRARRARAGPASGIPARC